jgi:hypothetical protein
MINMPGSMDGLKLAHAVRDRWLPIKILVVSGNQRLQSSDLPTDSCFVGSFTKRRRRAATIHLARGGIGPSLEIVVLTAVAAAFNSGAEKHDSQQSILPASKHIEAATGFEPGKVPAITFTF